MDVIIETPKGSRQKYTFDKEAKLFRLKKVLQTEGKSIHWEENLNALKAVEKLNGS